MTYSTPTGKLLLSATGKKLQVFYVATLMRVIGVVTGAEILSEDLWFWIAVGVAGLVSAEKMGLAVSGILEARRATTTPTPLPNHSDTADRPGGAEGGG